jgi:hypothetical protein
VQLSPEDVALARDAAQRAELGGASAVRAKTARAATLSQDQLVGQFGELALARYLGVAPLLYALTRAVRDANPHQGDEGSDLLATNVDVKCSLMRHSPDPWAYRLLVRPREYRVGTVYVLALAHPNVADTGEVALLGWATSDDLPAAPASSGPFAGAYVLPAPQTHPLPPLRLDWQWDYEELVCT